MDDEKKNRKPSRIPGNSIVDVTNAHHAKNELSISNKDRKDKKRKSMRKKNKKGKKDKGDDE